MTGPQTQTALSPDAAEPPAGAPPPPAPPPKNTGILHGLLGL
jgi:hypothetical protein